MRIAVHNPFRCFGDQTRNHNGYNHAFLRLFKPVIYVPEWELKYNTQKGIREFLRSVKFAARGGFGLGRSRGMRPYFLDSQLNPDEFEFAFSLSELNQKADVLISFNGYPYLDLNRPVRDFQGMKVYHAYEYVFRATDANRAFVEGGVDFLFGYTNHGKYCPFFQHFYPSFEDKVIPVPFGFGKRFEVKTNFRDREQKVIALGAVNPVNDPYAKGDDLAEYIHFYEGIEWTHQWRRKIVEHKLTLSDIVDCQLPEYPKTKDYSYDAVAMLNRYAIFLNDEGLMNFPPARTYEGTASGAVLVSADRPCIRDLGFVNDENCILHQPLDMDDFRDRVKHYLQHPEQLAVIAQKSVAMVHERYTHIQVAKQIHADLAKRYSSS
ncbi:MAG: glycosyltransferase [Pseudanabaena sp. ELA607]|jgi:hypothetical protein